MGMRRLSIGLAFLLLASIASAQDMTKKVKVFILAGQSNMVGQAQMKLAEYQSEAPEYKEFYKHLKKDGKWVVREDVWINFFERRGNLTVGYGAPGRIGPELEFGIVVGDFFGEQVLIIKIAWGGRSLGRDFLSPSSKMPPDDDLRKMADKENEGNRQRKRPEVTLEEVKERYGKSYGEMMKETKTVLDELGQRFPAYKGQGYEIVGFVWFQGWNDHLDAKFADAYASNMENFIRDVRKDLGIPKLPFVVAQIGQNGFKPAQGGMLKVQQAQAAMENVPDFKGNVKAVATNVFWDADADKLIDNWSKHREEWEKVGSDRGYHYLGSVRTFCRIGRAFGEAMVQLLKER